QNLTQLRPSSCGAQLPNRFTPIFANSVPNATSYEFEVTDTVTEEVETIIRDVRNFHLGLLEMEIAFNRVYAIRVRVVVDDQQMNYGTVCTVTTPMDPNAISRGNAMLDNSFKTYPNPFST
ncbi:hypothetical protein RZS08_15775, partial [Arthrospira platensis SPKY1]|nr:hypothetical protein [Arthrospira platensis SPKY1]